MGNTCLSGVTEASLNLFFRRFMTTRCFQVSSSLRLDTHAKGCRCRSALNVNLGFLLRGKEKPEAVAQVLLQSIVPWRHCAII